MVYLICSRINKETGQKVVDFIKSKGFDVHFPVVDTPQDPSMLMFTTNIKKIEENNPIIALAKGKISRNWAFEAGYALGLGKKVICLVEDDTNLEQHAMVHQKLIKVYSLDELEKKLDSVKQDG
jgi:nucleoside 2-deoxyribosyltransferase